MRGAILSEPKLLAVCPSLSETLFSAGAKIPGGSFQFGCGAVFGQNRNSWRYLPMCLRGVIRSEPKSLAVCTNVNARRFSASAEIPGKCYQSKCEVCCGQNSNSRRYVPGKMRGAFWPEPKFLAILPSLDARRFSVRTEVPGGPSQF